MKATASRKQEEDNRFGGIRKNELETAQIAGLPGLPPGKRRELKELNLQEGDSVKRWATFHEIIMESLEKWKEIQQEEDTESLYAESQTPASSEQESEWLSQDTIMEEETSRLQQTLLKIYWNQLIDAWKGSNEFPKLPMTTAGWNDVVSKDPEALVALLQQFRSPEFCIGYYDGRCSCTMDSIRRLDELVHCLDHVAYTAPELQ
ncbi:hypothetical protein GN244_ATG09262 [Phytophthora infestans]|uniref:Uncharacterized protein n=1 Tax=Phytophthora infestans TaxID=4787 RepID=A0A833WJY0_PHYIN|nr:hypothetical protein GN244_ATG09262 [Phytophthora infestans]